jgi:hypothetical protein
MLKPMAGDAKNDAKNDAENITLATHPVPNRLCSLEYLVKL